MGAPALLALSLGLSAAVAAAALACGRMVEALSADPRLRDRVWAAALLLPVLPPLAVGLVLLTPAPVRDVPAAPAMGTADVGSVAFGAAPAAPGADWTFEPGLAFMAVLVLAVFLTLARLATLALRAARLRRLVRDAREADPATVSMVAAAAGALSLAAPRIGVSDAASEPMLAGLRRPRLILPHGLVAAAEPAVARAMIAHELVHLKRGDHRALWLEEVLLALLAINPLMPVLRSRRAAAREEACDALALAGAGAATRRAYAESLIGALRSRAGPQPLPALTFTGAGRTTAMRRLKAVITPAAPAGRRARLLAAVAAVALAAGASAGSLAAAGEREAVVRMVAPAAASTAPARPQAQVARPQIEQDAAAEGATGEAAAAALSSLTPEQQARFRNPTGAAFQAICRSDDPVDDGFCAGVIFSQLHLGERLGEGAGVCLPAPLEAADEGSRRAALGDLVRRTKGEIARLRPEGDERAGEIVRTALARAYPCDAAAETASDEGTGGGVPLPVQVEFAGDPIVLSPGQELQVEIMSENGEPMSRYLARSGGSAPLGPLAMTLSAADYPRIGEGARAYELTGEIRGVDGRLLYRAEPVTLRLGPGARRGGLRPTLSFLPV